MKSESHTYIFFGRVLPERANVNISSLNFEWKNIEGEVIGELNTSILVSQINAQITLKQRPDELITLKNGIEEAMRVQLDLLGYTNSCGYDLEIIQVTDLLGNIEVFGANIDDTNQFPLKRPMKFNEIIPLFSTEKGDYLRLSLSDLREAIRNPKDSGFFCYRSIECLRQYFVDHKVTNNIEKDKKSWIIFRDELNIEKDDILFIKEFADPVRHGGKKPYSADDGKKMFEITWKVIDNYIIYACNGYQNELVSDIINSKI